MKIYKISSKKEAKIRDWFGPSREKFEDIALGFIGKYFSLKGTTPTIGEVISSLIRVDDRVDQGFLKGVAVSSLSEFNNSIQGA